MTNGTNHCYKMIVTYDRQEREPSNQTLKKPNKLVGFH